MKKTILICIVSIFLLSGCMYPSSELAKNKVPNDDQLLNVQNAVSKYAEETGGLVPIKTKTNDSDIYEKYLVDFSVLKEENILSEIPGNAYENGGIYVYTIVNPDDNPEVKLIDLQLSETIRDINVKLDIYRSKNLFPPFGEKISEDIFKINYSKLKIKEDKYVKSPLTQEKLPIVMNSEGKIFIDYRIDLMQLIDENKLNLKEGEDIRHIYHDLSPFVPVYSLPITIKNNEPVFIKQ